MKALKHNTTALALIVPVVALLGFVTPQRAVGGEDGWATAGKILTGAVAATVLHDIFDDDCDDGGYRRHVSVERRVVIAHGRRPCYRRPVVVHRRPIYRYRRPTVVVHRRSYGHGRPRYEVHHHHYRGCGHPGYSKHRGGSDHGRYRRRH